jgi:predicted ATPase
LLALFEQVAAGSTEFCMVSGHSGVGKSALVNEISKPLVRRNGYLIQGKFDQFQRGTPYSAVAVAFRSLIRQLLVEPDERKQALRRRLLAAVAQNGQLLIDLVPELELIIGPQPHRGAAADRGPESLPARLREFRQGHNQRSTAGDLSRRPAVQ